MCILLLEAISNAFMKYLLASYSGKYWAYKWTHYHASLSSWVDLLIRTSLFGVRSYTIKLSLASCITLGASLLIQAMILY